MSPLASSLSWVCALVMVLPAAPCARLGLPCPMGAAQDETAKPARSCCQQQVPCEHSQSRQTDNETEHRAPAHHCPGTCCIENATPRGPEKPSVEHPLVALAGLAAVAVADQGPQAELTTRVALPPGRSLQILYSLWRL